MKKLILTLTVAVLFMLLTLSVNAAGVEDLTFKLINNNTEYQVTDCVTAASGELVIPSTYAGKPVTRIADYAFDNCSNLTSITIPDTVKAVSMYAFRGSTSATKTVDGVTYVDKWVVDADTSITSADIADGTVGIANAAFCDCSKLGVVDLPDTVAYIGSSAFKDCAKLTSINLPDGITGISHEMFYGCTSLAEITIPNSVTSIGDSAFYSCSLISIEIPSTVTSIGAWSFSYCNGLERVTIPDSVTSIGDYAFYDCDILTNVTMGRGVTSIGSYAFNSGSLKAVYITDLVAWCNIDFEGISSNPLYCARSLYLNNSSVTELVIPDSVTDIRNFTFSNCDKITSITIPSSVTSIGKEAFNNCTSLTSITIPDSVTSIGENAFYYNSNVTSVKMGKGVQSVGNGAFAGCSKIENVYITDLTSWCHIEFGNAGANPVNFAEKLYLNNTYVTTLTIPDSVTVIGDFAFYNYDSLRTVTLSDSVTSIGKSAFYDCDQLRTFTFGNGVENIGTYAFSECDVLRTLALPDSVTEIGEYAFQNSDSLNTVTLGNNVLKIGAYAFSDCIALRSISIPDSTESIGECAFYHCTSLKTVMLGQNLLSIGSSCFYQCTSLEEIVLPDSLTSLGGYAFYHCSMLKSVAFGSGLANISSSAFYSCTSLESVTIPGDVIRINSNAFYGCKELRDLVIEDGVMYIDDSAFSGCTSLADIVIPDSVISLGYRAFNNCSSASSLSIGYGLKTISQYAFEGCVSLTEVVIPDDVITIERNAFTSCTELVNVTLGEKVATIGDNAFRDCTALTRIYIPESVTSISSSAFTNSLNVKIYCYANSAAHTYAESKSISYVLIGEGAVINIKLDKSDLSLTTGATAILTATFVPSDAANQSITWASSDESVATVVNGKVTAIAPGSAVITATSVDGGYTAVCAVNVTGIVTSVSGVALDMSNISLNVGDIHALTATVVPSDAANKNVTWTSTNASVATVVNGIVTAKAAGSATIIVTTVDGSKTATCQVTVTTNAISVNEVTLDKSSATLSVGNAIALTETVLPANATNKTVVWSSSNEAVATVANGVVTAKGGGKATVTVTTVDGSKMAVCEITVIVPVTNITIDKTSQTLSVGQSLALNAAIEPANATNKDIAWTSSNEAVATVTRGVVTAKEAGVAVITATADGGVTASCRVIVSPPTVSVTGVTLDKTSLELNVFESYMLVSEIFPSNASNKALTWTSSDESVATITDGTVKAISSGTATITVTTVDGGFTMDCVVHVTALTNAPMIKVAEVKTVADKTVSVKVDITDNPGIIAMTLLVNYDSDVMTLESITDGEILGTQVHSNNLAANPYTIAWNNGTAQSDFTANGTIVTLNFKVKAGVEVGIYPISLTYSSANFDIINKDFNTVDFVTVAGGVEVVDFTYGDVDGDGLITNKDSAIVARYLAHWLGYEADKYNFAAADVDGDGLITNKDSAIIARYLAHWIGYESLPLTK